MSGHPRGLLRHMVQPLRHKMGFGATRPLYIYKLNQIIRLQAVLEIITNQTAMALELMTRQQSQMCAAIYQNYLGLDYLLAKEGAMCGKFYQSNCPLLIDDNGQAVTNIATNITKLAHVPVQTWKG